MTSVDYLLENHKMNRICKTRWLFCLMVGSLFSAIGIPATAWAQSVTAPGAKLKLVAGDFKFTEGPAADREGNVYFTDQPNDRILRWDVRGAVTTFMSPSGRSNGLYFAPDGRLIACADDNNELWAIGADGTHEVLVGKVDGKRLNGPNDVWVLEDGTMYFTDPYYKRPYWKRTEGEESPHGVYRLEAGAKAPVLVDQDYRQPNGIVGDSQRKKLYVSDIGANKTYVYDIQADHQLSERRLFCEQGSDGMTLDDQGNLYLTGKPGVMIYNGEGKQIEVIAVPENWTANVTFGGEDRSTLFITASRGFYSIPMQTKGVR